METPKRGQALILGSTIFLLIGLNGPAGAGGPGSPNAGWIARWDGPGHNNDRARAMAQSPDGARLYVTGETACGDRCDFETVAYDARSGSELWTARYDGTGHDYDSAVGVSVSPDGTRVYVTGGSVGPGNDYGDFATLAYDAATGLQLWEGRFNLGEYSDESPQAIASDASHVYVTGWIDLDTIGTVAYDASTGAQLWAKSYGYGFQGASGMAVAPDPGGGRVYVTGYAYTGQSSTHAVTFAYEPSTGVELWRAEYGGADPVHTPYGLGIAGDGSRLFITGYADEGGVSASDFWTAAYDPATGEVLWTATYDGPGHGIDQARSLGLSANDSLVFVTGDSWGTDSVDDYATIAYRARTGDLVWLARSGGPAHRDNDPVSIAVNPSGTRVYVTGGTTSTPDDSDYLTIAYRQANGQKDWLWRYDGPDQSLDAGSVVLVDPSGNRVVVTGSSSGRGTHMDFTTLARKS